MKSTFTPSAIALAPAFIIVGPSATGSENGTPISTISAPASLNILVLNKIQITHDIWNK